MNENTKQPSDLQPTIKASTDAASADTSSADITSENHPAEPVNPYTDLSSLPPERDYAAVGSNVAVPLIKEHRSRKKLWIILGSVVSVFAVSIVVVLLFARGYFLTPKQRVIYAFAKTFGESSVFKELMTGNTPVGNGSLKDTFYSNLTSGTVLSGLNSDTPVSVDWDITIGTSDSNSFDTMKHVGMIAHLDYAPDHDEIYFTSTARIMFLKLSAADLYLKGSSIRFASPYFFDGYLYVDTESLGEDYKNSYFDSSAPLPDEAVDGLSFNLFDLRRDYIATQYGIFTNRDAFPLWKDLYDCIDVHKSSASKYIYLGSESTKCTCYHVTIDEDDLEDFIDDMYELHEDAVDDYLDEYEDLIRSICIIDDVDEDEFREIIRSNLNRKFTSSLEIFRDMPEFDVYLDRYGRLIEIDGDNTTIGFYGSDYLTDNIVVETKLTEGNEVYDLSLRLEGSTGRSLRTDLITLQIKNSYRDNVLYVTGGSTYNTESGDITFEGDLTFLGYDANLAMEGNFSIDKDTSSVTLEVDEAAITYDSMSLVLDGLFTISPLTDRIEGISGNGRGLLHMDADDFERLGEEITDNLYNMNLFDSFF